MDTAVEFVRWLVDNYTTVLTPLAYVALAIAVVLRFVAPLTNTKVDDKLSGYARRFYTLLVSVLVGKAALPALPPKADDAP